MTDTVLEAWPWLVAAVAVALLGLAVGYAVGRRDGVPPPLAQPGVARPASPAPDPAVPAGGAAPYAPPGADLSALVREVIAAHDLAAGAGAVQSQLEVALAAAGVRRIPVTGGAAFDAGRHHAVGTEPVADGGADRRVAREVRAGWHAGDQVVRPAEVIVWKR